MLSEGASRVVLSILQKISPCELCCIMLYYVVLPPPPPFFFAQSVLILRLRAIPVQQKTCRKYNASYDKPWMTGKRRPVYSLWKGTRRQITSLSSGDHSKKIGDHIIYDHLFYS